MHAWSCSMCIDSDIQWISGGSASREREEREEREREYEKEYEKERDV